MRHRSNRAPRHYPKGRKAGLICFPRKEPSRTIRRCAGQFLDGDQGMAGYHAISQDVAKEKRQGSFLAGDGRAGGRESNHQLACVKGNCREARAIFGGSSAHTEYLGRLCGPPDAAQSRDFTDWSAHQGMTAIGQPSPSPRDPRRSAIHTRSSHSAYTRRTVGFGSRPCENSPPLSGKAKMSCHWSEIHNNTS